MVGAWTTVRVVPTAPERPSNNPTLDWTGAATVLEVRTLVVGPGQSMSVRYHISSNSGSARRVSPGAVSGMRAGGYHREIVNWRRRAPSIGLLAGLADVER